MPVVKPMIFFRLGLVSAGLKNDMSQNSDADTTGRGAVSIRGFGSD
jgi:hypothetical protein